MGNPQFLKVEDNINLYNFSSTPYVRIQFWQEHTGTRYYRIKCTASSTYSSTFPTTYLYLGSYKTVPNWYYTESFGIQSVKNASLQNTSFEALFTQFPNTQSLRVNAQLQSSTSASFNSYETSTETRLLDINLKGDNFGPTWVCPTWVDMKYSTVPGIATLTGSNQKGVKGESRIRFNISQATARYGTSISKYTISVKGGFSHNLTPGEVAATGTDVLDLSQYYKLSGTVEITFTVEDSRGMKTTFTRTLTIVSYTALTLLLNDTHRQGGTGSTVILDINGKWHGSPLTLTCTGIVAKEEGSSSTYASLTPTLTVSGSSFSYKSVWSGVTFDSKKAYTVTVTLTDTLKTFTLTFPIPVGTPVLSIRDKKVGINNSSPSSALDVVGEITQNAFPVLGYKGIIGTAESCNLNDYKDTGYYIYKTNSRDVYNFPESNSNIQILLMVISAQGYNNQYYGVQKAWEPTTGAEYTRAFIGLSFRAWKKVTMT